MEIMQASLNDLDGVMALHKKYHIDSIELTDKPDGFVTTNFTTVPMLLTPAKFLCLQ